MVKVILQIYPVIPAADEAQRAALRPLGRNVERYQETLLGTHDIVRAADDLGLWGVATLEHHFHSEGYEVGPNPGLLNAYWAAITKRVRIGQLGYVLTAQNPLRVAEDTAILDHLTQGRCFVGLARGYQDRWTNILGQHLDARATHSVDNADDRQNRDLFEEHVDLLVEAWTRESIDHNTDRWQIPYPFDEGMDWWMSEATARLGAPGEIDSAGRLRRISVVPAPYTKPHPPVFVASSGTPATVDYCARKGFIPTYFAGVSKTAEIGPRYVAVAKESGRNVVLGENQAAVRWLQIGETHEQAREYLAAYDAEIFKNFYNQLSQRVKQVRDTLPLNATTEQIVDGLDANPQHSAGTVDEVRAALVEQWREFPAEYIVLIIHYAQQPKASTIRNLELFMREIKPALDEVTTYET